MQFNTFSRVKSFVFNFTNKKTASVVFASILTFSLFLPVSAYAVESTRNVTVNATVTNDDSGSFGLGMFTLKVDGTIVTSGIPVSTSSASHTVTVSGPSGYTTTFDAGCPSGVVPDSASDGTCTVSINDDITPYVLVPGNLIANPSFEAGSVSPTDWSDGSYGTNIHILSWPTQGAYSGSKSAKVVVSTYPATPDAGDAKWVTTSVIPISGGQYYTFSDFYKSNVPTEVDLFFTIGGVEDGGNQFLVLPTSNNVWAQAQGNFYVPNSATGVRIAHIISSVGDLTTDDYSLVSTAPPIFSQGMVTLSFDDGWKSFYTNGAPILNTAGLKSTSYIITGQFGSNLEGNGEPENPDYMSLTEINDLKAQGHDIGAHTKNHLDLTTVSPSVLTTEVDGSRTDLLNSGFTAVDSFAYPLGALNATVEQEVKDSNFVGARGIEEGFNDLNTDKWNLKANEVFSDTTLSQVQNIVDTAISTKTWAILFFHKVATDLVGCSADIGCITVTNFQNIVDYLKNNNVPVVTVHKGLGIMNGTDFLDTTMPVVTVMGADPQSIEIGNPYVELGATATDDIDGNITASIVTVSSSVDTNTLGSYTVTYDVTDNAGNQAVQKTRTVNVVQRAITVTAENKEKTYGDIDPALTYTVTGSIMLGDTFSGELSRTAGESIGTYPINQNTLALSSNYELTFVGANLVILSNNSNVSPIANAQSVSIYQNESVSITLGANDPELADLIWTIVDAPTHGELSGDAPNVTYAPDADYAGSDSFTFKVNDANSDSNTAITTIVVKVKPICPADFNLVDSTCVPKIDVCSNIDGIQESVPDGQHLDGNQCITNPAPVSNGGGGGGGGGGNGPIITAISTAGQVLGASTTDTAHMTLEELKAFISSLYKMVLKLQFKLAKCNAVFNTDLSYSMNNSDVKSLQKVLNGSSLTQITIPGNETSYFGNATKAGVIKFQNIFADEILTPMGLTSGNGIVGSTTRAQLNSLCAAQ